VLSGWPELKPGFFAWWLAFGVCQTLSTLALSKELELSAISLVTALWKVSRLILLGIGVTIGERPSDLGVAGVLLSATGVYLLNVSSARISLWAPLHAPGDDAAGAPDVTPGRGASRSPAACRASRGSRS